MSNISYAFMDKFTQRPLTEQLKVLTQNLKLLKSETEVDVSDSIQLCKENIAAVKAQQKQNKEQNGTPQKT